MTKQEEEQIINDSKIRMRRAFNDAGITITEAERTYIETVLADEVKTILTKCITQLPRVSPNRFKISCNASSVVGYHPIKGVWHQLIQVVDKGGVVRYYTDGIQETKNLKEADGFQLESDS